MNNGKYFVIIPVAGNGSRFGGSIPKQYTLINDKTVLQHTLDAFLKVDRIEQIVLIANPNDTIIEQYIKPNNKVIIHKVGGITRSESVTNGLKKLNCASDDWILVHDAARCCIKVESINNLIDSLYNSDSGGILASKATDTIKYAENNIIQKTINREYIYLAQTPQMFRYTLLLNALNTVDLNQVTDEASAIEAIGAKVNIVINDNTNIKITYPQDIELAKILLANNYE